LILPAGLSLFEIGWPQLSGFTDILRIEAKSLVIIIMIGCHSEPERSGLPCLLPCLRSRRGGEGSNVPANDGDTSSPYGLLSKTSIKIKLTER